MSTLRHARASSATTATATDRRRYVCVTRDISAHIANTHILQHSGYGCCYLVYPLADIDRGHRDFGHIRSVPLYQ